MFYILSLVRDTKNYKLTGMIRRKDQILSVGSLYKFLVRLEASDAHLAVGTAHDLDSLRRRRLGRLDGHNLLRRRLVHNSRCPVWVADDHLPNNCLVLRLP